MKNMVKIMCILILISVFFMTSICFARGATADKIKTAGDTILSAILWVGYAVALGMVVFIGIKYIMGSADGKANMKSAIVSWLIGAACVFMCTTIVGWITGVIGADTNRKNAANEIVHAVDEVGE